MRNPMRYRTVLERGKSVHVYRLGVAAVRVIITRCSEAVQTSMLTRANLIKSAARVTNQLCAHMLTQ
jgi:hypothetical protein